MRVYLSILSLICVSAVGQVLFSQRHAIGGGYLSTPLPTPLLWYKFNEGSGTNLTDSSGNGRGGWLLSAAWVTGASGSGNALAFNGSSAYARSSNNLTFGTNIITVCAWVWATNDVNAHIIAELSNSTTIDNVFESYSYQTGGNIYGWLQSSTDASTKALQGYQTNVVNASFKHIAWVYDNSTAAGALKIYVNAVQQTLTFDTTTKDQAGDFATQILWLASHGGASLFLPGKIDDLRIYSGELSVGQIGQVYADPQ